MFVLMAPFSAVRVQVVGGGESHFLISFQSRCFRFVKSVGVTLRRFVVCWLIDVPVENMKAKALVFQASGSIAINGRSITD